jgi:hypothetical protein
MTETFPVNVRFTDAELRQVHKLAIAEARSRANMLHVLVMEALAAREAKAAQK